MVVVPTGYRNEHPLRSLRGFARRYEAVSSVTDRRLLCGASRDRGAAGTSEASLAEARALKSAWRDHPSPSAAYAVCLVHQSRHGTGNRGTSTMTTASEGLHLRSFR